MAFAADQALNIKQSISLCSLTWLWLDLRVHGGRNHRPLEHYRTDQRTIDNNSPTVPTFQPQLMHPLHNVFPRSQNLTDVSVQPLCHNITERTTTRMNDRQKCEYPSLVMVRRYSCGHANTLPKARWELRLCKCIQPHWEGGFNLLCIMGTVWSKLH